MRQDVSRRDLRDRRIIRQVCRLVIAHERAIEVELLLVDKLEHCIGEDGLAHGARLEERVVAHRGFRVRVQHAE